MNKLLSLAAGCVLGMALPGAAASEQLQKLSQDPGQWVMSGKNYSLTRFSELDQINRKNVDDLQVAWTFSTGYLRGHEAAPLVVGNTMYIVTPWPNVLYALDLTKQGAIKWAYHPKPLSAAKGVACCDIVNRGAAYAEGKIFFNTLDNHTVAVNAETGKEVWKTKLGSINQGETMTMAPLVVKDMVLVGNSGGELGVRGWITALDIDSGEIVWRAYHTGPDEAIRIGEDFNAPYAKGEDKKQLGMTTWPSKSAWMHGGGTVWGWISYDPEADLIYYGSGNPGPWNPYQRPGANKWTASVFARDPDTGMAQWAYQWNPHDMHDYDGVNENLLLELNIDGQMRKVLVHADRNGYFYVLDRLTGEIISAEPFVPVNVVKRIDMETGEPVMDHDKVPKIGTTVKNMCPAAPGGKDWQPMSYSPETGLVYIPANNLCMDELVFEVGYIAGTPFLGAAVKMHAGPGGNRGFVIGWDPVKNEEVWRIEEDFPAWTGTLPTAGGLVFYGTMDRWFKAVDAETGELLWKFRIGSGSVGQPVTYTGPDGRQYVAILAGVGGWAGAVVAGNLDQHVKYGALGFVGATQDLPEHTAKGGTLYVFALPEDHPTPDAPEPARLQPEEYESGTQTPDEPGAQEDLGLEEKR